jgi:GTP-binding protein HflX
MLAAVKRPSQRRADVEESLEELAGLATAAGAAVGDRVVQERQAATPSLYFGRGKVEEMAAAARAGGMNLFISDDALTRTVGSELKDRSRGNAPSCGTAGRT